MSGQYGEFIAQEDEYCQRCNKDIPKGKHAYCMDDGDSVLCEDCMGYLESEGDRLYDQWKEREVPDDL